MENAQPINDNNQESIYPLEQGKEYFITFLSIDIAGSSNIVKSYSPDLVSDMLYGFKNYIKEKVEKFNGFIWEWEGDGGTGIFTDLDTSNAVLCGIEIILYLVLFNNLINPLPENINIRVGLHSTNLIFYDDEKKMDLTGKIFADDIQKQAAKGNNLAISAEVFNSLHKKIRKHLKKIFSEKIGIGLFIFEKQNAIEFTR